MSKVYYYCSDDEDDHLLSDKTVVIDLDATILRTFKMKEYIEMKIQDNFKSQAMDIKGRSLFFEVRGKPYWTLLRPHAREFILNCYSHFRHVIFWTAACEEYARAIIKLLHIYGPNPHFVFSRDTITTLYETDKNDEIPIKDLQLLSNVLKEDYDVHVEVEDMIAIDDLDTTFSRNPDNAIHIPEYKPELNLDSLAAQDDALARINSWIITNINKDIQSVPKGSIFD